MTADRDELHLTHTPETVDLIKATVPPALESLRTDANLRDATLYRLQTLAESAGLVSDGVKARHPKIPWVGIAGFRTSSATWVPCARQFAQSSIET